MMLWKCFTQYSSKFGKLSSGHRTGHFHFSPKEGQFFFGNSKIALTSHASKVMLKLLQARLQQYMNWGLPDIQTEFRKSRGTRDQIANICWIIEKQENSRKATTFASVAMLKPLTVWIIKNCGKFLKEIGIPDHHTCVLRNLNAG